MSEHTPDRDRRLSTPSQRYDARLARRSSTVLQRRVVDSERQAIGEALDDMLTQDALAEAAARIVAARRRYVTGSGKSHAYASLLAYDLGVGLSQVILIDGVVVRPVDLLTDVRAGDLMVAFSLRRYRRDTVDLATAFTESGGQVVAITDAVDAPLARIADQVITVSTRSASYADSPTAVAAAVHVLATLTTASAKGARRRLERREQLNADLGLYLNDERRS